MSKQVIRVLKEIGLNKNEINIYLAALKLGKANISNVAKLANIKRPTAYLAIQSLIKRDFIIVDIKNKNRPLYEANDPNIIIEKLDKLKNCLTEIFPELRAATPKRFKPDVEIHEGYEGMKKIYKELLNASLESEVLVYGTIEPSEEIAEHKKLYRLWMKTINNYDVRMREILQPSRKIFKYAELISNNKNHKHKVRIIPENFHYLPYKMKLLEGDNVIYNDKIAFFSGYDKDMYVITIAHKDIYRIYKNLFEMSWEVAEEY